MKRYVFASLLWLCMSANTVSAQGLAGDWTGELQLGGGRSLKLVLHITGSPASITMDSPDQGAFGMNCNTHLLSADSVSLTIPSLMLSYQGKLEDGRLNGTFRQGAMALPLSFTAGSVEVQRPQTPKPPYPYLQEQVWIDCPESQVVLAGTLTVPEGANPSTPIAILVSGSGLQNRDEELFQHKPFAVIADFLARHGIASLRYDDRGYAQSTGDGSSATTADFAADAKAVMDWVRSQNRFGKTGIIGHSEGGTIAYMLAAAADAPDFIVSVAGPAVKGSDIIDYQNQRALMQSGLGEEAAATQAIMARRRIQADSTLKWLNYLLNYDPADDLKGLRTPALIIYGEKDRQVPPSLNLEPARQLAPAAKVKCYPGLNHLMQHADSGDVSEYNKIEETFAPEVLADIVEFILTE